jgi:hypothetical protein
MASVLPDDNPERAAKAGLNSPQEHAMTLKAMHRNACPVTSSPTPKKKAFRQ